MIEAVIFDMDGVLVDSEPFWQEAEMEAFASVGINLTRSQCIETTGLPVKDVVAFRYKQNPWQHKSQEQICDEIVTGVEQRVRKYAVPLDGVRELIQYLKNKQIPVALASSSSLRLISTVIKKFFMENTFSVIHSAELEEYGKPHPAVFLAAAKQLRIEPQHCLVVEDSFNGLLAAKAARMKTLVVPMKDQQSDPRFYIADLKIESLNNFTEAQWNFLNSVS